MEEEYVPGSSICGMFVKEKVKLITFFDCKIEFGQQNYIYYIYTKLYILYIYIYIYTYIYTYIYLLN